MTFVRHKANVLRTQSFYKGNFQEQLKNQQLQGKEIDYLLL
ncbi:hypothetical protein CLU83_3528 [Flavobacterium sp. 1]|nr:hypothetical protein CLU83_3528 [Flavobacterium sp. 1]